MCQKKQKNKQEDAYICMYTIMKINVCIMYVYAHAYIHIYIYMYIYIHI